MHTSVECIFSNTKYYLFSHFLRIISVELKKNGLWRNLRFFRNNISKFPGIKIVFQRENNFLRDQSNSDAYANAQPQVGRCIRSEHHVSAVFSLSEVCKKFSNSHETLRAYVETFISSIFLKRDIFLPESREKILRKVNEQ